MCTSTIGTNFGHSAADVTVTIHGSPCAVTSAAGTEIVCETARFPRDSPQVPVAPVVTIDNGSGYADLVAADDEGEVLYFQSRLFVI